MICDTLQTAKKKFFTRKERLSTTCDAKRKLNFAFFLLNIHHLCHRERKTSQLKLKANRNITRHLQTRTFFCENSFEAFKRKAKQSDTKSTYDTHRHSKKKRFLIFFQLN
jgi:hypothetical protein